MRREESAAEEGLRVWEAGQGDERHVRHVCDALLDPQKGPIGLAHKHQAGHRHGRQDLLQPRTVHPPNPGGGHGPDVVRQQPRLQRWGDRAIPDGHKAFRSLLQYLQPRVTLCSAALIGMCAANH
jgi:hypothetical protein